MDYKTFSEKVRNSECSLTKLDLIYNHIDSRCWSAIINQGKDNIIVTYSINRSDLGSQVFDVFSSSKILTDIEAEDIYDVIEFMVSNPIFSKETATQSPTEV
jgi:hypothetical protein